jgi:hypothetical protein
MDALRIQHQTLAALEVLSFKLGQFDLSSDAPKQP